MNISVKISVHVSFLVLIFCSSCRPRLTPANALVLRGRAEADPLRSWHWKWMTTLWWTYKKLWKITIFNGKITIFNGILSIISMVIFNSKLWQITRGYVTCKFDVKWCKFMTCKQNTQIHHVNIPHHIWSSVIIWSFDHPRWKVGRLGVAKLCYLSPTFLWPLALISRQLQCQDSEPRSRQSNW